VAKEKMEKLTTDHLEMHEMVEKIGNTLKEIPTISSPLERKVASQNLTLFIARFREHLNDHLDREEEAVIDTISRNFTVREQKQWENQTMKRMPRQHISLLVPWIASTLSPEEARVALKALPLPLRVMYNLSWKKKYQKFTSVLFS
jgi:DNA mismatch repair ATPase MutL